MPTASKPETGTQKRPDWRLICESIYERSARDKTTRRFRVYISGNARYRAVNRSFHSYAEAKKFRDEQKEIKTSLARNRRTPTRRPGSQGGPVTHHDGTCSLPLAVVRRLLRRPRLTWAEVRSEDLMATIEERWEHAPLELVRLEAKLFRWGSANNHE